MGLLDKITGVFGKGVKKATTAIPGNIDDKMVQKAGEVAQTAGSVAGSVAGTVATKVQDVIPDSIEQKVTGAVSTATDTVKQAAEVVADKIDAVNIPGNADNRVAGTLHDFSSDSSQSQNAGQPTPPQNPQV